MILDKNKKGFVLSFSTILIASFLVLFALFFLIQIQQDETHLFQTFAIEKAGFILDDIDADFNKLMGLGVDVNRGSNLTTISFHDKLPGDINKLQLLDYNTFVDKNYSGQQNATLNLDLTNLTDNKIELIFSNALQYDYDYTDDSNILFYVPSGNTNVVTYDINISVSDSSDIITAWAWQDTTGDINVNLHFEDGNTSNTVTHYGKLDSSIENTYQWDYNTASDVDVFFIKLGSINGNSKAIQLSENFDTSTTQAVVTIKATILSPTSNLSWYYDADLNYSQGDVNLNRKIGLNKA